MQVSDGERRGKGGGNGTDMYLADLHIHSHYSRATSRDLDLPHLDLWARKKGIQLVGTGDFTHPAWREELKEKLIPAEEGFYRLKEEYPHPGEEIPEETAPRFVVSGEISSIYKKKWEGEEGPQRDPAPRA